MSILGRSDVLTLSRQTWYIAELLYIIATALTKASAGAMFLRITTIRAHRILIWAVMGLTLFLSVVFFFLVMFQCQPISFFWDPLRDPRNGRCISDKTTTSATYLHAAVVAAGDWTYSIFPFFLFRRLNLDKRTKISATAVLALANVGSIATLVRIKDIHEIYTNPDFLFVATNLATWSTVEVGASIAALSISTYRPLFQSFFRNREAREFSVGRSGSSGSFRNLMSPFKRNHPAPRRWPTIQKVESHSHEKALPNLPPSPTTTYQSSTAGTFSSNASWKRSPIYATSPAFSTIKIYATHPQQPGSQV